MKWCFIFLIVFLLIIPVSLAKTPSCDNDDIQKYSNLISLNAHFPEFKIIYCNLDVDENWNPTSIAIMEARGTISTNNFSYQVIVSDIIINTSNSGLFSPPHTEPGIRSSEELKAVLQAVESTPPFKEILKREKNWTTRFLVEAHYNIPNIIPNISSGDYGFSAYLFFSFTKPGNNWPFYKFGYIYNKSGNNFILYDTIDHLGEYSLPLEIAQYTPEVTIAQNRSYKLNSFLENNKNKDIRVYSQGRFFDTLPYHIKFYTEDYDYSKYIDLRGDIEYSTDTFFQYPFFRGGWDDTEITSLVIPISVDINYTEPKERPAIPSTPLTDENLADKLLLITSLFVAGLAAVLIIKRLLNRNTD